MSFLSQLFGFFERELITNEEFHVYYKRGRRNFCKTRLEVDFKDIDVSGCNFFKADLHQSINLKLARNLPQANWQKTNLAGVDFSETNMQKVVLRKCDLKWSNFSNSDLKSANISWSNLAGSNLSWADLRDGNLAFTNLRGANCSWADLHGANLILSNRWFAKMDAVRFTTYTND